MQVTPILTSEAATIAKARELVNGMLAMRDELTRLLGLSEISIVLQAFGSSNQGVELGEVGYILAQAVEMKRNDNCLQKKVSKMYPFGNVTSITDYNRRLEIDIHHNKK